METVVADVNASAFRGRHRPAVGPVGRLGRPIGRLDRGGLTVTLAAPKLSLVLPPAEHRAGDIVIADIGIPEDASTGVEGPRIELLTRRRCAGRHPAAAGTHKGDYGRVLVVAGSRGKTGAAHLAAMAPCGPARGS